MAWQRALSSVRWDLVAPLAAFVAAQHSSSLLLQASTSTEKAKEPFTGIEFDWKRNVRIAEAEGEYYLLATAVRCMLGQCKFAKARAYAVGLYAEDADEELQNISGEACFQALLSMQTSRNLVLVMDQDVAGQHIAKGFDRSLLPRVRKAQGGKSGPGKDALKEFTQCFKQQKLLRKGTEISLVWRPDDFLIIIIDSRVQGVIQSSILCEALFGMYLGSDSIFKKYRNMEFAFHKNPIT